MRINLNRIEEQLFRLNDDDGDFVLMILFQM